MKTTLIRVDTKTAARIKKLAAMCRPRLTMQSLVDEAIRKLEAEGMHVDNFFQEVKQ